MTEPTTTTTNAIAATPEGVAPPSSPNTEPRSLRVRIISSLGFAAIAIVGVLIVLYAWQLPPFSSAVETTENALVRGQVTIIGPQLAGYVYEVPVQDFQYVKAGDLLVRLDDRIYQQRLDQSLAQLAVSARLQSACSRCVATKLSQALANQKLPSGSNKSVPAKSSIAPKLRPSHQSRSSANAGQVQLTVLAVQHSPTFFALLNMDAASLQVGSPAAQAFQQR